jgi:hypothetical protein
MEGVTFRPSNSKLVVCWLSMALVLIVLLFWLVKVDLTDLPGVAIMVGYVLFQTLVLFVIMHKLPFFKIEVGDSTLAGPCGWGEGWKRIKLPIRDLDLEHINKTFQWFGVYQIKSRESGAISTWALDEGQFKSLVDLLKRRGGNAR